MHIKTPKLVRLLVIILGSILITSAQDTGKKGAVKNAEQRVRNIVLVHVETNRFCSVWKTV